MCASKLINALCLLYKYFRGPSHHTGVAGTSKLKNEKKTTKQNRRHTHNDYKFVHLRAHVTSVLATYATSSSLCIFHCFSQV